MTITVTYGLRLPLIVCTQGCSKGTVRARGPLKRMNRRVAPSRCGGMIYITVLMASTFVMVVGLSGLLAVRMQHHASEGSNRAGEARIQARSAIEMALAHVNNDPDWRTALTHDEWVGDFQLAQTTLRYKLVNPAGESLNTDPPGRVWLYAQAQQGLIERTTRVLLEPRSQLPGANLLRNPLLDEGGRHWRSDSETARLRHTDHQYVSGSGALHLSDRPDPQAGVNQDVSDRLEAGESYHVSAWVHMDGANDYMIFGLYTRNDANVQKWHTAVSDRIQGASWFQLKATITPQWTGELEEAVWRIHSQERDRDLFIDDMMLMPLSDFHEMVPVPGTWEQVVY